MATESTTGLETLLSGLGLTTPIPTAPSEPVVDVLTKPLDICRSYLADMLQSLTESDRTDTYKSITMSNDISNGDLAVIVPRLVHTKEKSEFRVFGFDLIQRFSSLQSPLFMLPFQAGPHLHVRFSKTLLPRLLLPYIKDRAGAYGTNSSAGLRDPANPDSGRMKVIIEFSSPNLGTEFHARHLRSTVHGAYIANLYRSMGWDVVKMNYLGDWGQGIGLLLGAGWSRFGSEEEFEKDPIEHLLRINTKVLELFDQELETIKVAREKGEDVAEIEHKGLFAEREAFFKKMEDADEEALALWRRVRDVCIQHYARLYERLNVSFDEYSGESQVSPELMSEVEGILKAKGVCDEEDGTLIIDFKKHPDTQGRGPRTGHGTIRKNGSSTYLLRDIAAVVDRSRKHSFDKMVYVADADQSSHFQHLFWVVHLMGDGWVDVAKKLERVSVNKVSAMSEELGGVQKLDSVLNRCKEAMQNSLELHTDQAPFLGSSEDAVDAMAITALLAQELSASRIEKHPFDIGKMVSFYTGTGPDMQYWYARLTRILTSGSSSQGSLEFSSDALGAVRDEFSDLLRLLIQYPEQTAAAYAKVLEPAPTPAMTYLVTVADHLSQCFGEPDAEINCSAAEKAILEAARQVMENGMKLLGMAPSA